MLLRRLVATTTGAIISKGAAIITALLLFRQLPTSDMGRYTAALTLVSFCAILGNAGLNPLTTREIARRGASGWGWWTSVAPLRLLLALGAYGLLVVVALFVPRLVDPRLALIAGLLLIPDTLSGALAATLGGIGYAALASWLDALSNLCGLLATLALVVIWHANVVTLAWLAVALAAWAFMLNGWALLRLWRKARFRHKGWHRHKPGRHLDSEKIRPIWAHEHVHSTHQNAAPGEEAQPKQRRLTWQTLHALPKRLFADWKYAMAAALPLGLGALAATLYFRVDTLFLSAARDGRAVAYYSAPYQIVEAFWLISTSWNAVMLPAMARRFSPLLVERSIALLLGIGLPASLVIAFRAEDIVTLLFGQEYLPAALPLRLVIWVVPILFSYVPLVTALFVHDRQRSVLYVLLINLALALLLDAMLIPRNGVVGASIATLLVEAAGLAGYLFLAQRANLKINWARCLSGPLKICLPLAAVLIIGQALPFFFILPAVLMLWSALFVLLGPWANGPMNPQIFSPRGRPNQPTRAKTDPEGLTGLAGESGNESHAPAEDTLAVTRQSTTQSASQGMVIW
jgi:O-antigen/teichoic acid export membrane protein